MPYIGGRHASDIALAIQLRKLPRSPHRWQIAKLYRGGVILDCECGNSMVAGVDHICPYNSRPDPDPAEQ